MAINFPDSPSVNDTHTVGDRTWKWDGTVWNIVVGTTSDHGNLAGLSDDDHTQYLRTDGTRTAASLTVSGAVTVDTDTFVVDNVNDRVGIGTNSPSYKLHVTGGSSNDSTPEFAIDGNGSIAFHNGLGAGNYNGIVQAGDKGIIFTDGTQGTGEFVIAPWASGSGGMRIDSSGKTTFGNYVSQPRAFFRAYKGTTGWSLTGAQAIVFDNTTFNNGNNYSTTTGRFTAPVAGYYHFGAHFFKYTTYTNSTNTYWGIFTSNGYSTTTNHGTQGQDGGQSLTCIVYMSQNDYAEVLMTTSSTIQSYGTMSFNSFYGYLLSA